MQLNFCKVFPSKKIFSLNKTFLVSMIMVIIIIIIIIIIINT